jgi:magnesium transporter
MTRQHKNERSLTSSSSQGVRFSSAAAEPGHAEEYAPETAGAIMSTDVCALRDHMTVGEAVSDIRRRGAQHGQLYYAYVVDGDDRLAGVLSMRDLVLGRPELPIARIMRRDVIAVSDDTDREEVARLVARYRYAALPVVDSRRRLLGIVGVDDVLDVLVEEATEDIHRMFAAGAEEAMNSPWHFSLRKRLPWLLLNLILAAGGALIVRMFEGTIAAWAALAVYMPVVAGMGGNASAQAMAVAIRGIAVGEAPRVSLRRVIARELRVGIASGLVTGALAFVTVFLLHPHASPLLAALVAVSLILNLTAACAWGASVPFFMQKMGFDPAQSATIFTTVFTDALGFLALLGLAALSLRMWG